MARQTPREKLRAPAHLPTINEVWKTGMIPPVEKAITWGRYGVLFFASEELRLEVREQMPKDAIKEHKRQFPSSRGGRTSDFKWTTEVYHFYRDGRIESKKVLRGKDGGPIQIQKLY